MIWWNTAWMWMQRSANGIALTTWLVSLLLFIIAMTLNALILLDIAPGGRLAPESLYYEPGFLLLAGLGALIITRWPGQVMGWLFCAAGLISMVTTTALSYEQFAGETSVPLLTLVLLVTAFLDLSHILILLIVVPLLYPNGRLFSPRWRPLLAIAVLTIAGNTILSGFSTRILGVDDRQTNANPIYISGLAGLSDFMTPLAFVVIPVTLIGATVSLGLRYRRSTGIERLQIRWLFWIVGLIITLIFGFISAEIVAPSLFNTSDDRWSLPELTLGLSILFLISIGIPAVLGLAILRYRLYSIDLIVNRTIVYGALTIGLAATYWIGVVVLQQALDPVTSGSNLAVAGSTLAVAALFQPLRRRIQNVVDRRFFRHKYDAATTIEAFNNHARDAVDLDSLLTDLRDVVSETMQPSSISIWLRTPGSLDHR